MSGSLLGLLFYNNILKVAEAGTARSRFFGWTRSRLFGPGPAPVPVPTPTPTPTPTLTINILF